MRRAISLDGITFDYPLFYNEEFVVSDFVGSKTLNINGGLNIDLIPKGSLTKKASLYSSESGWVNRVTKIRLLGSVDTQPKELVLDNNDIIMVYFDFSSDKAIEFEQIANSKWYKVKINLLKG